MAIAMTINGQQKTKKGKPAPASMGEIARHGSAKSAGDQVQMGNKMKENTVWCLLSNARAAACVTGLAVLAFVAGCGRDDVKVYRVAKEKPSTPSPATMPAGHPDITGAGGPQLKWKTPEGWNEVPPGEMRVASFSVKGKEGKQADVSVIPLPGAAGGDAANVNRWRGQLGLAPVTPEELQKAAQKVEVGGQPAELHDVVGKNPGNSEPTRILGVIQHRDDMAWFFKMTGDDQLVAAQKPAFVEFLKSLQFVAAAAQTDLPPSHPPIDGSAAAPAAAAISSEGKPNWQVPSGWQEVPGGQFLIAKFNIAGDGAAQAAVNVSMSAGDGGGLAANVNRWRKQLGLGDLSDDELAKAAKTVETAGGKATFVEMSGTDARSGRPAQLVGAMVTQSAQTWFYKLMGDAKVVEAQKDAFAKFVETVKY
jgi:hypothetical protein